MSPSLCYCYLGIQSTVTVPDNIVVVEAAV